MIFRRLCLLALTLLIFNVYGSSRSNAQPAGSNFTTLGGVTVSNITPALIDRLSLRPPYHGVVVIDINPNSPAALSGMKPGDVIQMANSAAVQNVTQLKDTLWREGLDPVMFQVSRQGIVFVFTVSLR